MSTESGQTVEIPASHRRCPVGHATALLGDRWSMLIVREALRGAERYQDLKDSLAISDHTLSRRLAHLQEIGVLTRQEGRSARYQLTEPGEDLARVLAVLGDWAMRWLPVELPLSSPPDAVLRAAIELGFDPTSRLAELQTTAGSDRARAAERTDHRSGPPA